MSELIDKNAVINRMHETMDYQDLYLPKHFEMCMNDAIEMCKVDAVEVVRCKDCEFYTAEEKWCRRLGLCGAFDGEGFCSHGERRSE